MSPVIRPHPPGGAGTVELLQHVRRIEIQARRLLDSAFLGEYHSVFRGRGMEFAGVREYDPGDDFRALDWNVTARMNAPYVRQYEEERQLTVLLAVDVSASGAFGSSGRSKLGVATEVAALLAFSATRNHDRVGLVAFSDRIEKYLPPRQSREHVLRAIRELVLVRPQGRGTDIAGALTFLAQVQRKRAVVFLLSDFYAPDFTATLRVSGRRHDVVALVLTDPAELDLPEAGIVRMEDAETGREVLVDTADAGVRMAYRDMALRARTERARALRAANVDVLDIRTDAPYAHLLYGLFKRRAGRR